jgi:transglutaminase superfamily protein
MTVDTKQITQEDVERVETNGHGEEPPEGYQPLAETDTDVEPEASPARAIAAALCTALATGVLAGGIFTDIEARAYAIVAALLGGGLAYGVYRIRSSIGSNVGIVAGLFAIGLVIAVVAAGFDSLSHLRLLVQQAVQQAHLVRPPIAITGGFAALLGWVMGAVGFVAVWASVVLKRPSLGLLLPLPVAIVAAISVSQTEQIVDGLILLLAFVIGLAISAGGRELGGQDQSLPLAFELRRAAKALPVLAVGTVAVFALAQTGFLFPRPTISPEFQAQRPKTEPLSAVPDKVLFEARSPISGPWVVGALDVYDGQYWLLPSYHDADLRDIPADGIVDPTLKPGLQAEFTIRNLTGAVLPTLPNTVGILASGPKLDYDARSGNIRLVEGEFSSGFTYKVAAGSVPGVADLQKIKDFGSVGRTFTAIPPAPPFVRSLISKAPTSSKWDEWDYLRLWVLNNVTVSGAGSPVGITPARVDQILQTKQGTPYEIVAIEAMLARWIGLPSRIGYGFDGGTKVGDHLEIHPKDGAAFPEVYFPGYGWLPVLGQPAKAKASENSNPNLQQFRSGVLPSQDISVSLFLPAVVPPETNVLEQVRNVVLLILVVLAIVALIYFLFPAVAKIFVRSRRRAAARAGGPRARIAHAYSEWRDLLTDFGYRHPSDTPIMLLNRFPEDEDHAELAWLVTRALWGDLEGELDNSVATDAEELAATLKRRLRQAHPITVRGVAAISRLSLREPYAVDRHPVEIEEPREMARAV